MTLGGTEKVTELAIPTSGIGKPDKNPRFIINRVYQGFSWTKPSNYDFVYYNRVIKPVLISLIGT